MAGRYPPTNKRRHRVGDWLFHCPVEGKIYWASEAVRRWDGLMVGPRAAERRHEQDLIQHRKETPPAFTSPEPEHSATDNHLAWGDLPLLLQQQTSEDVERRGMPETGFDPDLTDNRAIPGIAQPGIAIPGKTT